MTTTKETTKEPPKNPIFGIIAEAVKVAQKAPPSLEAPTSTGSTRTLEIVFYGMACFDPLQDRPGYRVLFPNGLVESEGIDVHSAGVWVRGRDAKATARWSGGTLRNDFFVSTPGQMTITGLAPTPLNAVAFEGHVVTLTDANPEFTISPKPDAVIDMIVDRGTLSAHEVGDRGMIVVKWQVQADDGIPVRFTFDKDFIEIPPTVKQIYLANVSALSESTPTNHDEDFQLYAKLSANPSQRLEFKAPPKFQLIEPTFGYETSTPVATVETPNIVCSPVLSRLSGTAVN